MQFEVKFSKYKHGLDGRQAVTYLFDTVNGLGVTVVWHEDGDDEEGERVDMTLSDVKTCLYTVAAGDTVRVLLTVPKDGTAMLLRPTFVDADGVETRYAAFELEAGGLYHLPVNIVMDAGEDPNAWVLRNEHDQVVLTIRIRVD